MNDIAISVKNLTKVYHLYDKPQDRLKEALHPFKKKYHHDFYAMQDVSFEIKKGETVGIIGKNGAGKSTLLKMITGVLTPTSGEIEVNGKIASLLELGAGFNPEMTGIENIYLNGTIMGFTKEEMDSKVDAILEFADIGEFIHQPVKMYSSGMFARLAFSVAINVEPDVLIVDEALSVGDMAFQAKCFNKFKEIKERGATILFVTHSIDEILRHCTLGIVFSSGKMISFSSSKEATEVYKTIIFETYEETTNKKLEKFYTFGIPQNENHFTFGDMSAEIIEAGIFDSDMKPTTHLLDEQEYLFKFKVKFNKDITSPVFGLNIRDKTGLELCGTNSYFKNIYIENIKENEFLEIKVLQKVKLAGGQYFVSFNCTYLDDGAPKAAHRIHDLFIIDVITTEPLLGLFKLEAKMDISYVK
jgi:teichoic acid transport system ATP-binding protein